MKGLDLRKFKKVSSDEHTTVMQHPDGHKITIAHNRLKGDLKQQLEKLPALAKGGPVKDVEDNISYIDKPDKGYGGIIFKADGGMMEDPVNPQQDPVMAGVGDPSKVPTTLLPEPDAGEPPSFTPAQGSFGYAPQSQLAGAAPENVDLGSASTTAPEAPAAKNPIEQAMNQQIAGVNAEAKASGELGKEQANILAQHQIQQQKAHEQFQQDSKAVLDDFEHITNDIKAGHIDPERYQNSKSDLGKISSAIGLVLGGVAGGVLGQENPALKFLNAQIDRDVDAQKTNLSNKNNILHALNVQYGNMKDATNMTRAIYADQTANKIQEAAARSTDPLAKARAQQAIAAIKQAHAPALLETAQRQALLAGTQKGTVAPEALVPHLVPKEHQEAVYKEIERAQNTRKQAAAVLKAFDTAAKQWKMTGAHRSGQKAFEAAMGPTFADIEGTVRQAAMDNAFKNMTPQAMDTAEDLRMKRQSVVNYLQSKSSAPRAASYGINLPEAVQKTPNQR